jgi:hypothetical protein
MSPFWDGQTTLRLASGGRGDDSLGMRLDFDSNGVIRRNPQFAQDEASKM